MENFSENDFAAKDNSSNVTRQPVAPSLTEYQVAVTMWEVWPPCILLLGGFGNVATIFVMRRIKDHNSSQYAILMALAVSDIVLLYSGVLREWIRHVFFTDVRNLHTWVCKLHKWILYGVSTTSAWLLTCVTVQRTAAVLWPHKMRTLWTLQRTRMVVAALFLTAFTFHFHLAMGMQVSGDRRCDAGPGLYEYFYRRVFSWVDMCVSSLIPSICLFLCDIILSFMLFKTASVSSITIRTISHPNNTRRNDTRKKTASRTTVMVLALSCTFLVLTLPVYVFYPIWYTDVDIFILQTPEVLASMKLVSTLTHLLWYSNSAINFFLYCLTGTKYRTEFFRWILCRNHTVSSAAAVAATCGVGKSKQDGSMHLS